MKKIIFLILLFPFPVLASSIKFSTDPRDIQVDSTDAEQFGVELSRAENATIALENLSSYMEPDPKNPKKLWFVVDVSSDKDISDGGTNLHAFKMRRVDVNALLVLVIFHASKNLIKFDWDEEKKEKFEAIITECNKMLLSKSLDQESVFKNPALSEVSRTMEASHGFQRRGGKEYFGTVRIAVHLEEIINGSDTTDLNEIGIEFKRWRARLLALTSLLDTKTPAFQKKARSQMSCKEACCMLNLLLR